MMGHCSFCGRHSDDCPGGLWHVNFGRPRADGYSGICLYCARSAIRCFGEQPDPNPVEPIGIFSRRVALARLSGEGTGG